MYCIKYYQHSPKYFNYVYELHSFVFNNIILEILIFVNSRFRTLRANPISPGTEVSGTEVSDYNLRKTESGSC